MMSILCEPTESTKAEMTSRSQACALATAVGSLGNVTSSQLECDVSITSSDRDIRLQIPFVACHSPPFNAEKPSLTGYLLTFSYN